MSKKLGAQPVTQPAVCPFCSEKVRDEWLYYPDTNRWTIEPRVEQVEGQEQTWSMRCESCNWWGWIQTTLLPE